MHAYRSVCHFYCSLQRLPLILLLKRKIWSKCLLYKMRHDGACAGLNQTILPIVQMFGCMAFSYRMFALSLVYKLLHNIQVTTMQSYFILVYRLRSLSEMLTHHRRTAMLLVITNIYNRTRLFALHWLRDTAVQATGIAHVDFTGRDEHFFHFSVRFAPHMTLFAKS